MQEQIVATLGNEQEITVRRKYKVIAETGLFKRGEQYDKDSIIELDEATAARFKELGEVEDV